MEETWEDLYNKEYQAKKNTLFDLDRQARASRQELREVKGELEEIKRQYDIAKRQCYIFDKINLIQTGTHFLNKYTYEIIPRSGCDGDIKIKIDDGLIDIIPSCHVIFQDEESAKEALTKYISDKINGIYSDIDSIKVAVAIYSSIKKYKLEISQDDFHKLKRTIHNMYLSEIKSATKKWLKEFKELTIMVADFRADLPKIAPDAFVDELKDTINNVSI